MNWHNFASRIIQFFWLWKPYSFETVQFPLKITILRLNIRRKYHLRNNPTKILLKLAFFHIIATSLVLANRLLLAKPCFFHIVAFSSKLLEGKKHWRPWLFFSAWTFFKLFAQLSLGDLKMQKNEPNVLHLFFKSHLVFKSEI